MQFEANAPRSLRFVHGMEHAGLSAAALDIERSRAFKHAFSDTVTEELGFAGAGPELIAEGAVPGHLVRLLDSFGPEGHPPEQEIRAFLMHELGQRAASTSPEPAEHLRSCCIKLPPVWVNCDGYTLLRDGTPWTIEAAVSAFEERHGRITDPAVRSELAAIRVYVQLEWDIPL